MFCVQYFTGVDGNVYHVCSFYCKEYLSMFLSMTQSVRTFYKLPQRCYQYQLLQRCMRMCDLMHLHQASYAALKCPRHAVFFWQMISVPEYVCINGKLAIHVSCMLR